jgi:Spy/CpxP family protein refolding chaperone
MTLLIALVVAGTQVWAQEDNRAPQQGTEDRRGGEHFQRKMLVRGEEGGQDGLLRDLLSDPDLAVKAGISEQQMIALRTGLEALKPELEKLRWDLEKTALEQAELMSKMTPDENALMQAVEKTGAIRTEMAKTQMKSLLLVRRTLSPEQIEKVKVLVREKIRDRFGDRMKEWRERGAQPRREDRQGNRPNPPPPAPDSVL